jgi:hypothetical protein
VNAETSLPSQASLPSWWMHILSMPRAPWLQMLLRGVCLLLRFHCSVTKVSLEIPPLDFAQGPNTDLVLRSVQEVGLPVGYITTRVLGGGHDAISVNNTIIT